MKENEALNAFNLGLNCAQSVVTVFSEDLNFDNLQSLNLAFGFGGGMGRLQETCGAVTGAFMVLGIYNSKKQMDLSHRKEACYSMIRKFNEQFLSIHGSTKCRTLLNCDMNTEEGRLYMKKHNLRKTVCEKCISGSVRIIRKLINDYEAKDIDI